MAGLLAAGSWTAPFLINQNGHQLHYLLSANNKIYLVRITSDNPPGNRVEILEEQPTAP